MTLLEWVRFLIDVTSRFISPPLVAAEWVLVAGLAIVLAFVPNRPEGRLGSVRTAFRRLAERRGLAILLCGALPVLLRLALLPVYPIPFPSIHDEFSHLLMADTLAHGRLSNPTHPMWMHFESIHVIQQPTYNSMYPPAHGVFLAVGQVLFGEPWFGVLLGVGAMCAASCWMMQGWLGPAWALYGTLVIILKIGITGFWMNSYVGGPVPALGGALLIGSLPRLRSPQARPLHAALFALGLVILMNSRPFDGALLGFVACVYLALTLQNGDLRSAGNLLIPAAAVLGCGIVLTGYYNWRVTGSPLRMPYQVNRDTYGWPENLAFLPPKHVKLRHPSLQAMYVKEVRNRQVYSSPRAAIDDLGTRLYDNWSFFVGPILTVPLILIGSVFRDRRTRPLIVFVSAIALLNLFQLVLYPYHLGPIMTVIFAIATCGIRYWYAELGRNSGRRALCSVMLLPCALLAVSTLKHYAPEMGLPMAYWDRATEPHRDPRAYIESWLSARPRKQLVLVRYAELHPVNQEWVYNGADINGSKVLWAREMDRKSNARLLAYFHDREAWLVEADVNPQRAVRYSSSRLLPEPCCTDEAF